MKRISIIILVGLVFGIAHAQLLKTSLRITVLNELGNPVDSVSVTIYSTETDYKNNQNPVLPTQYSNAKGMVTFKILEEKTYYIDALKDDFNNYGGGIKTDTLLAGRINKINTIID